MIIFDIPIYTRDGDIKTISSCKASSISRYKAEKITEKHDLILIKSAAFGPVILSGDTGIIGGGLVKDLKLYDEIVLNTNLQHGKDVVPSRFLKYMKELEFGVYDTWKTSKDLTKYIKKLLKLNEVENRVALRYIKQLYEYKNNKLMVKGKGAAELVKCFQIIAWKTGLHANYDYVVGGAGLTLKDNCPLTIIDHQENKITSKIIEIKHIPQFKKRIYQVSSKELPILPTTAGMFTF